MKKKLVFICAFCLIALMACPQQPAQTFDSLVWFKGGIKLSDGYKIFKKGDLGTGGSASLISLTWDSVKYKPLTFPPAVHNHDAIYKPLSWKADWNADVVNKPTLFDGKYSSLTGLPNFNLLFRSITWKPDYKTDILNLPAEIELSDAIIALGFLPIPSATTAKINATVVPKGMGGVVRDTTIKPSVYKLWDGTTWSRVVITSQ